MHALLRRAACALPLLAAIGFMPPAAAQLKAPAPPPPAPAPAPQSAPAGAAAANQNGGPPPVDPLSREFRDCVQKAQTAMQAKKADDPAAIYACLSAEVKRQDAKVVGNAAKLAKSITADDKKRLDEANTHWRRFRDSHCLFIGDPKGAPPVNLANADCQLNLTVGRALDLDRMATFFAQQEQAARSAAAAQGSAAAPAPATPAAPAPAADAKK